MEAAAEAVVAARLPAFLDYAYATVSTGQEEGEREVEGRNIVLAIFTLGSAQCCGPAGAAGAISNKFYKLFKFLFMQRCKVKPADS